MTRFTMLFLTFAASAAQAQSGPADGRNGIQGPPPRPPRVNGPDDRPERSIRSDVAMGLVDYFDYPTPIEMEPQAEVWLGMGNEALWECQMARAVRIAEKRAVIATENLLR